MGYSFDSKGPVCVTRVVIVSVQLRGGGRIVLKAAIVLQYGNAPIVGYVSLSGIAVILGHAVDVIVRVDLRRHVKLRVPLHLAEVTLE